MSMNRRAKTSASSLKGFCAPLQQSIPDTRFSPVLDGLRQTGEIGDVHDLSAESLRVSENFPRRGAT
jgi:hypothetical protein